MYASKKPMRKSPNKKKKGSYRFYPNSFKLKAIQLHLEEGIPKG